MEVVLRILFEDSFENANDDRKKKKLKDVEGNRETFEFNEAVSYA